MHPSDLALILSSSAVVAEDERFPLDQVRMQKAAFLVAMRGTPRLQRLYKFEPYNWGPYSSELTSDLRRLAAHDLVEQRRVQGHRYGEFSTTELGETRAAKVFKNLDPSERRFLRSIRKYVTQRSFNRLLRDVYQEYPKYATKSQFSG